MKIKLHDALNERNNWLGWSIINMISNLNKFEQALGFVGVPPNERELDIVVSINGIEMQFDFFIKRLEEEHHNMLKQVAKELIQESFGDLLNKLEEMKEYAEMKLESDVLPSWKKE